VSVERIPTTPEELEMELENTARRLEVLGLTNYEAKAYIALLAHGYGDAETISKTAKIPRTSAYKALQALNDKGLCIATQGRPVIYKPEPPSTLESMVTSSLRETIDKLETLHEIVREKGTPQLIFTIAGKSRVLEKIGELIDKSTETLIISTPKIGAIIDEHEKKLMKAQRRGVRIQVITLPGGKALADAEVVRRKGLIATDIITDELEALIADKELEVCGYTDNIFLAQHLKRFLEIVIEYKH
jgi:sugar-specific transcriptional regulator TrmB